MTKCKQSKKNLKKEQEIKAQQLVIESFEARLAGERDYSLEETVSAIDHMIKESC